ncbi:hypothetical protein SCOCK_30262 [Actinacidiphila cocklensis]|uniref:Uncharacterized protein n=1 Tax=Actinacidiphila cocklensis TaxID=887465 RepID=A0A9W4GS72_9ACTN|nr:hypothetical protein SCOCK_30262 [Actinacidiphila cocklensis]
MRKGIAAEIPETAAQLFAARSESIREPLVPATRGGRPGRRCRTGHDVEAPAAHGGGLEER